MYLHTFQMTPPATSVAWCGVKTPGRLDREDGAYLRHWLPELRRLESRGREVRKWGLLLKRWKGVLLLWGYGEGLQCI